MIAAFRVTVLLVVAALPLLAEEPADDTKAIVALSELNAQMQLNGERIVGLTLSGEQIEDESLKLLDGLDRLQSLTLRDTNVTGAGLKHLQGLSLLGSLTIENSPISDRDIDELAAVKSVVKYNLRGTRVSGMGKQRLENLLRKAKREATVQVHFGGFLGVAGSYTSDRCKLTTVVPDSAAAEAGFEVGDVITKFNGQPIKSFPELAEAVALTPPQQPVRVTIERSGQTTQLTVTLRQMDER